MKQFFLLITAYFFLQQVSAQEIPRFNPDTVLTVYIDSAITVKSSKLNIETFINEIINDTSFYQAFREMKRYNFIAENRIFTYNKDNKVTGKIYQKLIHDNDLKNKVKILAKQDSGKIYKKNGKYQLRTVEMFDYIFMNAYRSDFSSTATVINKNGDTNQSYKDKLKTLLFSPGRPVKGIPIISNKTEIFSANMRQYYDYQFFSGTYLDSIPVYRFKVTEKTDLSNWTKDGIMIKELTTIFDKRNMQILGRYVNMKYDNMMFDFNVKMNIELGYFNNVLLPAKISYQGNWDIPFKKEENVSFLVLHKDYKFNNQE